MMLFHFSIKITRTFVNADKQVVTNAFQVKPEYVGNDQRTMHQYFSDAVDNCLAEDDLVEVNTEGPFLFDARSGFRSIKAGTIKIGDFVKSIDPSSVAGCVGTYVFVMNVAATLKGVDGPLNKSRCFINPDNCMNVLSNMLLPSAGQQADASRRSPSPGVPSAVAEEAMIRNRDVSSTAKTRALADASAGDYNGAIVTLQAAISLLKQCKLAGDDRTRVLIGSLKDCLHGIEVQKKAAVRSNRRRGSKLKGV